MTPPRREESKCVNCRAAIQSPGAAFSRAMDSGKTLAEKARVMASWNPHHPFEYASGELRVTPKCKEIEEILKNPAFGLMKGPQKIPLSFIQNHTILGPAFERMRTVDIYKRAIAKVEKEGFILVRS